MNVHITLARFFPVLYHIRRNNHGRHFSSTWREYPGCYGPLKDRRLTTALWKTCAMSGGCHKFLTILAFKYRPKKAFRLFSSRFYSQNVLSGLEGSDTGFNPTRRALDRADRQFELLGAEATFQGSAQKLEDAPKLKLPEVMSFLKHTYAACYCLRDIKSIIGIS